MSRWRRYTLAGLLFLDVLLLFLLRRTPHGRAHLWVFPRGEGLLILTPTAQVVLVDVATDPLWTRARIGYEVPPWARDLALAVLTRDDPRLWAAQAAVLEAYPARWAWTPAGTRTSPAREAWSRGVARFSPLTVGATWQQPGLYITVRSVSPPLLQVQVGRFTLLYARGTAPLAAATAWVVDQVPTDAALPWPPLVIVRRPLPPGDANAALAVLRHPDTRLWLAEEVVVHLETDGLAYRWEAVSP